MNNYDAQWKHATNLLNAYLAVKENFLTFQLAVEKLCPDLIRSAPQSGGKQIFADVIRLEQWYWDEELFSLDDSEGVIRCENLIVTTDNQGFVELKAYQNTMLAEETFSRIRDLFDKELHASNHEA